MKPKTGGAEPLPYEGNANHRKEIPKFLFCNSSEERANDVRPYQDRQDRQDRKRSSEEFSEFFSMIHPQQPDNPKFIGAFCHLVMLLWVVKLASELKRILRILSATLQRNAIAIRIAPATE